MSNKKTKNYHVILLTIMGTLTINCSGGSDFSGSSDKSKKEEPAPAYREPSTIDSDRNKNEQSMPNIGHNDENSIPQKSDETPSVKTTQNPSLSTLTPMSVNFSAPPKEAVTKGSFTAWTNPVQPAQGQPYRIIIQITLPSNVTSYNINDLSGTIVGTDTYTQGIGRNFRTKMYPESQTYQTSGNKAQVIITIPGAYSGVRDTINVASDILNERQNILLTFGGGTPGIMPYGGMPAGANYSYGSPMFPSGQTQY
ncbi:MAG: hypothetical protein HQK54_06505 [Oligoflexales bacterium]|nr:hypothetical protein [Oligoflexales bacterium]